MSEREGEVEALALAVHDALRCNCDSGDGDRMIAEELHASLWLRAHDDRIRAEAWDEAVQALAWATDNGNDPLGYVARNNPYAIRAAATASTPPFEFCPDCCVEGGGHYPTCRVAAGTPTHHTTEEDTP